jgi:phosphoribosylglycinamide formyltransferase 1
VTRLVVLASGGGSNLQAVLEACADGRISADVVAVIANRADAPALQRLPDRAHVVALRDRESRSEYDVRLAAVVESFEPDWVILAGWMRILSMAFLGRFDGRVINLHPALPGELPGTRAIERAVAEWERGARTRSGVMVHLVPDEGVDVGPVLDTAVVPFVADDTLDSFAARMHQAEHALLVAVIARLATSGLDCFPHLAARTTEVSHHG